MSGPSETKNSRDWVVDISATKSVSDFIERSAERRKLQMKPDIATNRRLRPYGRREIDNPNRSAW